MRTVHVYIKNKEDILLTTTLLLFFTLSHKDNLTQVQKYYDAACAYMPQAVVVKNIKTTAYITPDPKQKNYKKLARINGKEKKTASGSVPRTPSAKRLGTIAAGQDVPYGTILFVPGYGLGVVEDRGDKIDNGSLDLYFGKGKKAYGRALLWGVQHKDVVQIIWKAEKGSI